MSFLKNAVKGTEVSGSGEKNSSSKVVSGLFGGSLFEKVPLVIEEEQVVQGENEEEVLLEFDEIDDDE